MSPIPSQLRWPLACFCVGMRSLSPSNKKRFKTRTIITVASLIEAVSALGCGAGSAPPPPPPLIEGTVKPATASLVLGGQATFTAAVTNTIDAAVGWSVNGVPNGNTTVGTITPAGVYTAPADLPSPATVQITATSHAGPAKSGTGNLAITSDITLNLTPNPPRMPRTTDRSADGFLLRIRRRCLRRHRELRAFSARK